MGDVDDEDVDDDDDTRDRLMMCLMIVTALLAAETERMPKRAQTVYVSILTIYKG